MRALPPGAMLVPVAALSLGLALGTGCKSEVPLVDESSETPEPASPRTGGAFSASLSAELSDDAGASGADGGSGSATATAPAAGATGSTAAAKPAGASADGATPGASTEGAATSTSTEGAAASAERKRPARPPVTVPEELRAIQLTLLPNWERDVEAAGTFSRFITVHSRDIEATFVFHYGYAEPDAPTDRDEYKKFLAKKKILDVAMERQRGAAWYLQGTDRTGKPAFRFVVRYGGKHLVCYGSLYKHSPLGDIRDEVVLEAQKICESLAL